METATATTAAAGAGSRFSIIKVPSGAGKTEIPVAHQAQGVGAGLLVDQHQVRLHVAVMVISPLAA